MNLSKVIEHFNFAGQSVANKMKRLRVANWVSKCDHLKKKPVNWQWNSERHLVSLLRVVLDIALLDHFHDFDLLLSSQGQCGKHTHRAKQLMGSHSYGGFSNYHVWVILSNLNFQGHLENKVRLASSMACLAGQQLAVKLNRQNTWLISQSASRCSTFRPCSSPWLFKIIRGHGKTWRDISRHGYLRSS